MMLNIHNIIVHDFELILYLVYNMVLTLQIKINKVYGFNQVIKHHNLNLKNTLVTDYIKLKKD